MVTFRSEGKFKLFFSDQFSFFIQEKLTDLACVSLWNISTPFPSQVEGVLN